MVPYRRLQQYALAISILSVFYNGAEGAVSIGFGAESSSRSLVFFGIQSAIEVLSSAIVVWRFRKVAAPGEEREANLNPRDLRFEKIASVSIGTLLVILGIATEVAAMLSLALHHKPDISNASLIISASTLVLMIIIWLPKRWLAHELNSSAMQGEAKCSLSCIQMTIVLFLGSLIYRVWRGGWWVDSATCILLGLLFAWDGLKMLRWAMNPNFTGGCCQHHHKASSPSTEVAEQRRDLCDCCSEKTACQEAGKCQCIFPIDTEKADCGKRLEADGTRCCTFEAVTKPRQKSRKTSVDPVESLAVDVSCTGCCNTPKPEQQPAHGCSGCCCAAPVPKPDPHSLSERCSDGCFV